MNHLEKKCCDGECNHDDCCGKITENCTNPLGHNATPYSVLREKITVAFVHPTAFLDEKRELIFTAIDEYRESLAKEVDDDPREYFGHRYAAQAARKKAASIIRRT